jgi:uncharacterized protein YndB with AHSA1/START domain
MATTSQQQITVSTTINAPIEMVWIYWTDPAHITKWNFADDSWHAPSASNELKVGGKLNCRMEAKDGSEGFDFIATYDEIKHHEKLVYHLDDQRKVEVVFKPEGQKTVVTETFDAENQNPVEMQQAGWQAILDNFKKHAEGSGGKKKLSFEIEIAAPAELVFEKTIEEKSYRQWTAPFNPTSHYIGSWKKGEKILFIGEGENGEKGGMVSRIAEIIPGKFISIEHLGVLDGDKEITSGPQVDGWKGAMENYTMTEKGNVTVFGVELDANAEFEAYFSETWPKALNVLKELCETNKK